MTVVASFEIRLTRFLDEEGRVVRPLPPFAQDPVALVPLYRAMVMTRAYDTKSVALQRTGQLGTFPSSLGQEAVSIGAACALRAEDIFFPSYRDFGGQLWRGVRMEELFLYWAGDERGNDFAGPRADFPISVPIATQLCHAVGAAYAMKLRREPRVALAICGDGGTSKGDFYEALNMAGVWQLPTVFVINNNQWAISVPRHIQSATQTLAQKAIAAGIAGEQVDGNDIVAMRAVTEAAVAKARAGGGGTLIEALTYRLGDHTTADDASRYRSAEEVKEAWKHEPILRLRKYLASVGAWTKEQEEKLARESAERVQAAVEAFLAIPKPGLEAMFDYTYAKLPADLKRQRDEALALERSRERPVAVEAGG